MLVAALAACGSEEAAPQADPPVHLTIAVSAGFPKNSELVFDSLVMAKGDDVLPLLATAVAAESNNRIFSLPLRKGVTWHDGKPLTADDVAASLRRAGVQQIQSVVPNGDSVTVNLKAPDPEFPRRVLARTPIMRPGDTKNGTGPYKLTAPDTLTANPSYFGGKPQVATIKATVIPQAAAQLAALRAGKVHLIAHALPARHVEELRKQDQIGVAQGTEFGATTLTFNTARPPFDRPEVRRAIARGVDVEELVNTALYGQGTPGSPGFVHIESPLQGMPQPLLFDPEQGRRELDSLGAKAGPGGVRVLEGKAMRYRLIIDSGSSERLRAAELIRDKLHDIGIAVEVKPVADVRKISAYDLALREWPAPVQLSGAGLSWMLNTAGFESPALRTLTTSPVLQTRIDAAGTLQNQIAQQVPFLTLYYPYGSYAFRKDVYDGWRWQNGATLLNRLSFVEYELD
ncbi:ABC transporter substrate-binding protein [Nonomuraea sp. NPDC050663]|uniref:ABC transporter substrate-binding protein n=1 Tax=Nonomuraea sp. NPDC050663 TaxID=3364370 RepID=UPI0037911DF6